MSVGFCMLVHTALHRAAQVARHWAVAGCPVVIHVDRRVPKGEFDELVARLEHFENIRFCPRHRCDWGTFSLVEASQSAARMMLSDFPEVNHVYLASGACLPLRPARELTAFLAAHPDTDFIESVKTEDVPWTIGGLSHERFALRFPFSWKTQRRLFDRYVRLQRRLGVRRRIPAGIEPHLGSQWWCLTRRTLSAILHNPRKAEFDRYFRRVWIPDESYYQTLARSYSRKIESRSLTLSKFDFQGKPHVFYDDHLQLLRRSDCFVARKIWPEAQKLYDSFLSDLQIVQNHARPAPARIDRVFAEALHRRVRGRPGLYMQSRFPRDGWENGRTAAPYSVFQGFDEIFEDFPDWVRRMTGVLPHGHLFAPGRVGFAGGETVYAGAISDSATLRDYNPQAFLTNLIWATRGERQVFQFSPRDNQQIAPFMAGDANAQIAIVSGAWAIPLFRSSLNFADRRREAARLQKIETRFLASLHGPQVKARARIWPLADFLAAPVENLQEIAADLGPHRASRMTEAPALTDLTGFGAFLQQLRNEGMQPHLMGEFPVENDAEAGTPQPSRIDAAG